MTIDCFGNIAFFSLFSKGYYNNTARNTESLFLSDFILGVHKWMENVHSNDLHACQQGIVFDVVIYLGEQFFSV